MNLLERLASINLLTMGRKPSLPPVELLERDVAVLRKGVMYIQEDLRNVDPFSRMDIMRERYPKEPLYEFSDGMWWQLSVSYKIDPEGSHYDIYASSDASPLEKAVAEGQVK